MRTHGWQHHFIERRSQKAVATCCNWTIVLSPNGSSSSQGCLTEALRPADPRPRRPDATAMPTPLLGRCVRRCICQPLPAVRAPLRRGPVRSRPLSTTASTASPPVHAAQRRCPAGRAALLLASPRDGGRPATAAAAALSTTARRAFVFPSSSSSSSPSGAEDAAFPSATERDVLAAALLRVPELGFTAAALAAGAADAGYPPGSAAAAAVGGGVGSGVVGDDSAFALVRWHLVASRRALGRRAEEVFGEAAERGEKLGMGRKIEALVWERLMMNRPLIARWQEVCGLSWCLWTLRWCGQSG